MELLFIILVGGGFMTAFVTIVEKVNELSTKIDNMKKDTEMILADTSHMELQLIDTRTSSLPTYVKDV